MDGGLNTSKAKLELFIKVTTSGMWVLNGRHSFEPAFPEQTLDRGLEIVKIDRFMIALAASLKIPPLLWCELKAGHPPRCLANRFNHALVYSPSLSMWIDPTVSHSEFDSLPLDDQGATILQSIHNKRTSC